VEFHLIEGMMMKMLPIQFDSIVNWIQMKLMKVIHIEKNMMIQEFQHFGEFQLIERMKMKMPFTSQTIRKKATKKHGSKKVKS
jgi:hypothetical protein